MTCEVLKPVEFLIFTVTLNNNKKGKIIYYVILEYFQKPKSMFNLNFEQKYGQTPYAKFLNLKVYKFVNVDKVYKYC